jgi:hypothetical protein
MKVARRSVIMLVLLSAFFLSYPHSSLGFALITPEEAVQSDGPVITSRGIDELRIGGNGPEINILSPKPNEVLRTPLALDIAFEASSDKTIDYESLSVKYLKLIAIDLTDRLKPYLRNNRLTVHDVSVPLGRHRFQLSIAYQSGEKTTMEIALSVEK